MRWCSLLLLAVLPALAAGCRPNSIAAQRDQYLDRQVGRPCTVQFRRDALGLAGSHPLGPNADRPPAQGSSEQTGGDHSRDVEIRGTLTGLDATYLILRRDKSTLWIPQSSILMVRFDEGE